MKFLATTLVSLSLLAVPTLAQTNNSQKTDQKTDQKTKVKRVRATTSEEAFNQQQSPAPVVSSRTRSNTQDNLAWLKARSTVGGFISNASDLSAEGASLRVAQGGQVFRGSGSLSTESALGVAAQMIDMRSENWGWFAGASIEQSRQIYSGNLNLGDLRLQGPFTNKPRFLPLIISGGAVYKFNSKVYVSGGLNYTVFKDFGGGDLGGASMNSKFGYQYGVGFKPLPRVSLEIMQRDVRFDLDGTLQGNSKVQIDDLRLVGFNLIGRYELE
jgi:hypothetical protein